ncbi:MAG: hypothetical protein FJ315_02365 [SAR202 cluster bacterium]|nr:hypothetical protein [SAR202 cluster bacterium]
MSLRDADDDYLGSTARTWKSLGATALMVNTISFSRPNMQKTAASFRTASNHLAALRRAKPVLEG